MNPPQSKRGKSPLPGQTEANNPSLFPVRQTIVPPSSKPEELIQANAPSQPHLRKSIPASPTAAEDEPVSIQKHTNRLKHCRRREEKKSPKTVPLKSASSAPVSMADYRLDNPNPRRQRTHRPPSRIASLGLAMVRLLIVGVGLGAIIGTVLSNITFVKPLVADVPPPPLNSLQKSL